MTVTALAAGASGMNAAQGALGVSAHNVANMGTQGFQPQRAGMSEAAPAGSGVTLSAQGVQMAQADGASGTDFASENVNSLVYQAQFQLSAKVVQAADQQLGTLLDIRA
ncbi:flagellar basal body rod C-terminal domain-containing protein [Oxalobacteraceae bacterium A2-2]